VIINHFSILFVFINLLPKYSCKMSFGPPGLYGYGSISRRCTGAAIVFVYHKLWLPEFSVFRLVKEPGIAGLHKDLRSA